LLPFATCYLQSISARELAWLLAVAPHVAVSYNAEFFIEELGRLVDVSPVQVAEGYRESEQDIVIVSEPLDRDHHNWVSVPENRVLVASAGERARVLPSFTDIRKPQSNKLSAVDHERSPVPESGALQGGQSLILVTPCRPNRAVKTSEIPQCSNPLASLVASGGAEP
jgi:hypothetical protein